MNIKKTILFSLAATTLTFSMYTNTAKADTNTVMTIEKKKGNNIEFTAPYEPFFSFFFKPGFMGTYFDTCFPWTNLNLENTPNPLTPEAVITEIHKVVRESNTLNKQYTHTNKANTVVSKKPTTTQSDDKPQIEQPVKPVQPVKPNPAPQPQPTPKPESTPEISGSLSQFENKVVQLTNAERTKAGLPALKIDTKVSGVARIKSEDMLKNGYFGHTSPTYGSPFDMMTKFGVSYSTGGENIAQGQSSPEEVVKAWMNSSGHRANILNTNFTHIGVGYASGGNHWTQMFIAK